VKAWNFTKNKPLKLVDSMKADLFICRFKSEHKYSGKKVRQMHVLRMTL